MNDPKRVDIIGLLRHLRSYAGALTRYEPLAEELVQDTLVRALELRSLTRSGDNLRGWLLEWPASLLHSR